MEQTNYSIAGEALVLSLSQHMKSAEVFKSPNGTFNVAGNLFHNVRDAKRFVISMYRLNSYTYLKFIPMEHYIGMVSSVLTFQRDGGKTMRVRADWVIKRRVSNSTLVYKLQITVLNTSLSMSDRRLIAKTFGESIIRGDSRLNLEVAKLLASKLLTQKHLL